ncbi:MAG: rod-binding protein [Beijerinckiaceae bacterium]|nr:rod-binding protein [Beijerinckiaceae bacterium]
MSINPVSDIVLDVARAADPGRARAAAEKLSGGSGASRAGSGSFEVALASSTVSLRAPRNDFSGPGSSHSMVLQKTDSRTKAYKGLEQLVLKNLVETMLPKESAALFGSGTAGDIWRSLLADQLASEIGKTADLGAAHRQSVTTGFAATSAQTRARQPEIAPADQSFGKHS